MAASTPTRLISGALGQLTASTATYYTTPVNKRTIISRLVLCNTTGTARTVDLYLVPSGGSATAANQILTAEPVAASTSYIVSEAERQVLESGGTIQASADAASAVTIIGSGSEVVTG